MNILQNHLIRQSLPIYQTSIRTAILLLAKHLKRKNVKVNIVAKWTNSGWSSHEDGYRKHIMFKRDEILFNGIGYGDDHYYKTKDLLKAMKEYFKNPPNEVEILVTREYSYRQIYSMDFDNIFN